METAYDDLQNEDSGRVCFRGSLVSEEEAVSSAEWITLTAAASLLAVAVLGESPQRGGGRLLEAPETAGRSP